MAKSSIEKTNVMRLLDQKKVPYTPHTHIRTATMRWTA